MIRSLLLSAFLALSVIASPVPAQKEINHAAMHRVEILTYADDEGGYCTATAIGPHAILTAAHCLMQKPIPSAKPIQFTIDANTNRETHAQAGKIVFDGNDHIIVELKPAEGEKPFVAFVVWIDPQNHSLPVEGRKAYFYGAPKLIECLDCYREGSTMGAFINPNTQQHGYWYQMPAIEGDSGAAIYDDQDRLIGVVKMAGHGIMGALDILFTAEQWKSAVLY